MMNPWDDFWSRVNDALNKRDGEALKKLFVGGTSPLGFGGTAQPQDGGAGGDSGGNGPGPHS